MYFCFQQKHNQIYPLYHKLSITQYVVYIGPCVMWLKIKLTEVTNLLKPSLCLQDF